MERLILMVRTREALLMGSETFCRSLETLVVLEVIEETGCWRARMSGVLMVYLLLLWVIWVARRSCVASKELLLGTLVEVPHSVPEKTSTTIRRRRRRKAVDRGGFHQMAVE